MYTQITVTCRLIQEDKRTRIHVSFFADGFVFDFVSQSSSSSLLLMLGVVWTLPTVKWLCKLPETAAWGPNHPRPRGLRYWFSISLLFLYLDAPTDEILWVAFLINVFFFVKSYAIMICFDKSRAWEYYAWNWTCSLTLFMYIDFALTVLYCSPVISPLEWLTWLKIRAVFFPRHCGMTVEWWKHKFHKRASASSVTVCIKLYAIWALIWQKWLLREYKPSIFCP